jgi:hypothetical protein
MARTTTLFFQKFNARNSGHSIHALDHVDQRKSANRCSSQCFHLNASAIRGANSGNYFYRVIAHFNIYINAVHRNGMAQRNQIRGALSSRDCGNACYRQSIAFGHTTTAQ